MLNFCLCTFEAVGGMLRNGHCDSLWAVAAFQVQNPGWDMDVCLHF